MGNPEESRKLLAYVWFRLRDGANRYLNFLALAENSREARIGTDEGLNYR